MEEVEINGVVYGIKKLSFGEYRELIKLSAKVKNEGGKVITDIDPAVYQEKLLYFTLVKPEKYYRNQEEIDKLDYDVAMQLIEKAMEVNGLTKKKANDVEGN